MSERLSGKEFPSNNIDELLKELLITDEMPLFTDEYDERQVIFDDVKREYDELVSSMLAAAERIGFEMTEEDAANWQPDLTQIQFLREKTAPMRKRLRMIEGALQYEEDRVRAHEQRGVPLRPYQHESVQAFTNFLINAPRSGEAGGKSGIIEMPTGTGKTGIFANIASMLKHGEHADEPVKVLVIVPTQTILDQTMGRKGDRGFGKFAPHLNVGAYYQYEKELDKEVVVMTASSFNSMMQKGTLPHFDAVIVDEAHTVIGEKTGSNIQTYCQDKIAIGLTATPEYDEVRSAYSLFEHKIHEMEFQDAVTSGKLSPVRGHLLEVEPEYDKYQLPIDPDERQFAKRKIELEARMMQAVKIIEEAVSRGLGVIVRCPAGDDINLAVEFAKFLNTRLAPTPGDFGYRPIVAEHVGGSYKRLGTFTKDEIFDDFNDGKVDVLTYVKAIGMGWDSPHAKVLINLASTTSAVEMRQAIGRIMRLMKDIYGEATIAEAYDFKDSQLGTKQYTCLDALKTESGQLLTHDKNQIDDEIVIPTPRRFMRVEVPEVTAVIAHTVGQMALEHTVDAELPDNLEITATVNALKGDFVPLGEASRILGVSIATLKNILFSVGSSSGREIPKDELVAILELFPDTYAEDLPETGYVSARDVTLRAPKHVRLLQILPFARRNDITPWRFRGPDGKIGFYFTHEDEARLHALIAEGALRRGH